MTRKLKALGLALLAALAIGAIAAQVGSAGGEEHIFTTTGSSDETVLTGEQTTEGLSHHEYTERTAGIEGLETSIEKIKGEEAAAIAKIEEEAAAAIKKVEEEKAVVIGERQAEIEEVETEIANFHEEVESPTTIGLGVGSKIECTTATYTGSFLEQEVAEFAVLPDFNDCLTLFIENETVTTIASNDCTFRFGGETTENSMKEEAVDAPFALVCGESEGIVIKGNNCTIHVPPQEELHGVSYENLPEDGPEERDALQVTAVVTGVTATSTGGVDCIYMGLPFFQEESSNFSFEGEIVFTGYEGEQEGHETPIEGEQVDFAVE